MRTDRRLCRTCSSYYKERYGYCVVSGRRVMGHITGRLCWRKKSKEK